MTCRGAYHYGHVYGKTPKTSGSLGPSRFDEAATPGAKSTGSPAGRRAHGRPLTPALWRGPVDPDVVRARDVLAGIAVGAVFLVALILFGRVVCP